jgi:hypothetical protein
VALGREDIGCSSVPVDVGNAVFVTSWVALDGSVAVGVESNITERVIVNIAWEWADTHVRQDGHFLLEEESRFPREERNDVTITGAEVLSGASLSADSLTEERVEQADVAGWPSESKANLEVQWVLESGGAPAGLAFITVNWGSHAEVEDVTAGGAKVSVNSNHAIWEVEIKVSAEVAVERYKWVENESFGFVSLGFSLVANSPGGSSLNIPGSSCVPIESWVKWRSL